MSTVLKEGGYSATVSMRLEAAGRTYEVSELGPDTMMLKLGQAIPPDGLARLVIDIDGDRKVHELSVACIDPTLPELAFQ